MKTNINTEVKEIGEIMCYRMIIYIYFFIVQILLNQFESSGKGRDKRQEYEICIVLGVKTDLHGVVSYKH